MILKTLEETPASDAEWIMWVDIDTVIADMQVLPRFDEYDGYDLVVWGDRAKLMEGNLNEGAQHLCVASLLSAQQRATCLDVLVCSTRQRQKGNAIGDCGGYAAARHASELMPAGINCGVLLVRNTDWAREFFADVGQYAYMPKEELMSVMRPVRARTT